ncbi:MAG: ABC transporter ATP-binding protein [Ruminococcaceae bacterium]|nr:ABC transporter ATP-binding protein [Oscillospiraceae bacterium]
MNLNVKLPKRYESLLSEQTSLNTVYTVKSDLDVDGNFTDDFYISATKEDIFVFEKDSVKRYKITDFEDFTCSNQVNGAILVYKSKGEEYVIARCTMTVISLFACFAKGVKNFINGDFDKIVINKDKEKFCKKCGRILPGTNSCPKCDSKNKNLKRLLLICKPHIPVLTVIIILMFIGTALSLFQQQVLREFIDGYLAKGKGNEIVVLVFFAIYFGIILLNILGAFLRHLLCSKLGIKVADQLRRTVAKHLQTLSLSSIQKRSAGELIERVTGDTVNVRTFITDCFCNMFSQIVTLLVLVVVMLIMNWRLALCAFVFAPLIIIFARTFWPKIRKIYHRQWRKTDRMQNKLQDVLSGIRIVKTYGKEKEEVKEFNRLNDELQKVQTKNEKFFATFFPTLSLLIAFGSYLIVYTGGSEVLGGTMTTGQLMQFIAYSGMLLGPLNWMSFLPRNIVRTTTSLERIYDVLDEKPEIVSNENAVKHDIIGDISLKNVVFGYKNYEPVLDGIDIDVNKGEMIGLVGSSGCGKSTFINLIMRLYDVDEGIITVDGVNIKDMDVAHFHSQIGVVLQETFLFGGTVLDNIRFACPTASLEDIIKAAKNANAHEFICKLPDGYNTYIGEKGHKLSGGEKQRIAIARAILTNPKILILDEATSALDTESEYQVQQALERLRKDRTTFAIAHRLSTLRCADRIAVINDKKIAEIGTHNELLKTKGIYYGLVMAQLQMNKTKE